MTTHEVVRGDLFLDGRLFPADSLRILAPGMEMTTRRRIGRVGDFALEDDPFGTPARIRFGHRGQKRIPIPRRLTSTGCVIAAEPVHRCASDRATLSSDHGVDGPAIISHIALVATR